MSKLLATGKTDLLEGFVSMRTRRGFKAFLAWNKEENKVAFEFEPRPEGARKFPPRKTAAAKTAAAPPAKKVAAKKAPAKKVAAKKTAAKKAPAKKAVSKTAVVKVVAKKAPAAKPEVKATVKVAVKAAPIKPAKPVKVKIKLVRDSFTMPADDWALIDQLKARAIGFKRPVKKSELLRAGLQVLAGLPDSALLAALDKLLPLKPGRPKADKKAT